MKNENIAILAAIGIGGYYIFSKSKTKDDTDSGGGFSFDLGDFFSNFKSPENFNIGDFLTGLLSGNQNESGNILDSLKDLFSGFTNPLNIITPPKAETDNTSLFDLLNNLINQPSKIILSTGEAVNTAGAGIYKAATGVLIAGGTYVGVKTFTPIAPAISNALKTIISGAVKTGSKAIGAGGAALLAPVSSLPPVGVGLAAAGAFAGGYALGNLFNQTPAGQAVQKWSGNIGASLGASNTGLGQVLFPKAQLSDYAQNTIYEQQFGTPVPVNTSPFITPKKYITPTANIQPVQVNNKPNSTVNITQYGNTRGMVFA